MKKAITSFSIRAAALLALMVLTILIAPSEARADASGYCGTNGHETEVSWSYNATTATLTISGSGAIKDYDNDALRPGWDVYKPLIKKVVINNGVTAIGKFAFSRFYTMPDITIPASITTIGDDAFFYCSGIKSVTFAGGSQLTVIGDEAFTCCIGLTSITIPDHVETIGASTFMGCFNLTSVTIPASMTTIGNNAFYDCDSMTDVYCYVADPAALTWEEGGTLIDFMAGKATKCHVFDKAAFDAKWTKGENTDVNVTFVGDLCTTPVNYIDADGRQQSCRVYTILTGGGSTTLDGGWYIVDDDNIYYTTTGTSEEALVFSGDAHIILCGKNALTTHGSIKSTGSLTIYCQSSSKCILTVDCDADAHGLYAENGSVTINGGTVIIESNNGDGIRASGDITINGGIVTAMSSNGNGIRTTGGDITLGYRDGSDKICANSYAVINNKTVKIADGKHYIVNSNLYIGTLTSNQQSAIGGQDLESPNNYLVKIYDDNTYCIKIKFAGDANYRTWENADYSLTPQPGEDCFYFVVDKSLVGSTVELLGTDNVTEADVHGEWKPADARFIVTDCNGAPVSVAYTYGNDPNNLDLDCRHKDGSFIMPAKDVDVCVKAYMPIPYVDENGDTKVLRDGYVLLPQPWEQVGLSFYGYGEVSPVSEWYVGYGDVDSDTFGGITFKENSDTKLILCDGADIQIRGRIACSNLTIYGQSNGTGRLTITGNSNACILFNSDNWADNGRYGADLSIYGGTVSVTGSDYGIQGGGNVNLCGGTFSGNCKNQAFFCEKLHLYGGTVMATTSILIWEGTTIATGLAYNAYNTDGSHYYMGSIGSDDLSNLGAVTLTPLPAVTLNETDGVTTLVSHVGEAVGVMFTRSFSGSKASTLCLPYDFEPKGGTFYEFTSVNDAWTEVTMTSVNATSTTPLTAGKPYLFMPTADGQVDFTGIITNVASSYTAGTMPEGSSDWKFTGTYEEKRWDANNNPDGRIFGFATGQGYEGKDASTVAGEFIRLTTGGIKPFRAYLKYTGSLQARTRGEGGLPETMTVRLVNANGEILGIGEIRLSTGEVTFDSRAWYDLNGRRLEGKPSEKGIYINGGRKVVIK